MNPSYLKKPRTPSPIELQTEALFREIFHCVKKEVAPLNVTGKKPPIFFMFPLKGDGGGVYARLAKALGPDQQSIAFQVPTEAMSAPMLELSERQIVI